MSLMRFYFTPGSCSTGIHILLEELELVFAAHPVNLIRGEQYSAEFLALNPKASVPVLVLADGSVLSDFVAIAWWLAKSHPRAALLPDSPSAEAKMLELMNYIVNTIHGLGFTRIFTTEKYTTDAEEVARVVAQGRDIVERGLACIADEFAAGSLSVDGFSLVDAALFYVEFWSDRIGMVLPAICLQHYRAMLRRPAVRQVLMEEGYHATLADHAQTAVEQSHATA